MKSERDLEGELAQAKVKADAFTRRSIVHRWTGSAPCGLSRRARRTKLLVTLCARLEGKARSGAPFDAAFAVTSIEEEFGRVRAALLEELERAARSGRG